MKAPDLADERKRSSVIEVATHAVGLSERPRRRPGIDPNCPRPGARPRRTVASILCSIRRARSEIEEVAHGRDHDQRICAAIAGGPRRPGRRRSGPARRRLRTAERQGGGKNLAAYRSRAETYAGPDRELTQGAPVGQPTAARAPSPVREKGRAEAGDVRARPFEPAADGSCDPA